MDHDIGVASCKVVTSHKDPEARSRGQVDIGIVVEDTRQISNMGGN